MEILGFSANMKTNEIGKRLRSVFPALIDWNPTDKEYRSVSVDSVVDLMKKFPAEGWQKSKWECEEIAKAFVVDVRRDEAKDESVSLNMALGVANCSRLNGEYLDHTVNILITETGIYLIDMQACEIRKAERGKDEIFFVEM